MVKIGSDECTGRGSVPMWLKGLTLEGEIVRNPSVILSPTLARNEKVEHYIRIKTHKPIALRFWVESGVSIGFGLRVVSVSYVVRLKSHWCLFSLVKPPPYKPNTNCIGKSEI